MTRALINKKNLAFIVKILSLIIGIHSACATKKPNDLFPLTNYIMTKQCSSGGNPNTECMGRKGNLNDFLSSILYPLASRIEWERRRTIGLFIVSGCSLRSLQISQNNF